MSRVIVIEFVSLDGVIQDPDGNEGSRQGGWAFRYGPEPVTGDPFTLGDVLDTGATTPSPHCGRCSGSPKDTA